MTNFLQTLVAEIRFKFIRHWINCAERGSYHSPLPPSALQMIGSGAAIENSLKLDEKLMVYPASCANKKLNRSFFYFQVFSY